MNVLRKSKIHVEDGQASRAVLKIFLVLSLFSEANATKLHNAGKTLAIPSVITLLGWENASVTQDINQLLIIPLQQGVFAMIYALLTFPVEEQALGREEGVR